MTFPRGGEAGRRIVQRSQTVFVERFRPARMLELDAAVAALQRLLIVTHPRVALSHWLRVAVAGRAARRLQLLPPCVCEVSR